MPVYSCGAKSSHPTKLARTSSAAAHVAIAFTLALALPIPATSKHPVNWLPAVEDQGSTSSCTSHALSQGLTATCSARGTPLGFVASPHHFYSCSGGIARAAATPLDPMPSLMDDGRELADNITAVMTCGVAVMHGPTPDGRNSDVWSDVDVAGINSPPPANVNAEPSVQTLEASAYECLSGAHTVDLSAANAGAVCAAALDSGLALYAGFLCGSAFMRLGASEVAQPTAANDTNTGGHAVTIVSYRINAAGAREYLVRNSWGTLWADAGNVWASEAWLLACWEVWVLDETLISKAAA